MLERLGRSVTTDSGEMERSAGKDGSCCEAARECVGEKGGGGMLHTSGVRGQESSGGGSAPFGDMGVGVLESEDTAIPKWFSSGVGGRGMFGCGPASRDTRLAPRRGRMASCVVSDTVYFWFLSDVRGRDSNSSDAALFSPWKVLSEGSDGVGVGICSRCCRASSPLACFRSLAVSGRAMI